MTEQELEKMLSELGMNEQKVQQVAEDIRQGDTLLLDTLPNEPALPPQLQKRIESSLRRKLPAKPHRPMWSWAERLLPIAAMIAIALLVIWPSNHRPGSNSPRQYPISKNDLTPFTDDNALWNVALHQRDIYEETIDVVALTEVLYLMEEEPEETPDNTIGKEYRHEKSTISYYTHFRRYTV